MRKTAAAITLFLVFLAASFLAVAELASGVVVAENSWVTKAPMREPRGSFGVAVVNNKIYAIGGSNEKGTRGEWDRSLTISGGAIGANEEYDPELDKWIDKTPMPTPRIGFSIAIFQDKIYCLGGYTNKPTVGSPTPTTVVEVYDPAINGWQTKSPMPSRRENFATIIYQNKIYVIGGIKGSSYTGLNEVYDPATDSWENKTQMPTAKAANAKIVNGKIYFMGGRPNNTLTQVYNPASDSWAIKASLPTEAYGASAVVEDKIYFIGGSYSGHEYYVLNQIYSPETDSWSQGATPASGDVSPNSIVVTTGEIAPKRIYVIDEKIRVYNTETDSWTLGANITTNRLNLGIALVNDMVYAIGGLNYFEQYYFGYPWGGTVTPYATNEQYTPFGYGTIPPRISIFSPENRAYNVTNVSLAFSLNRPVVWMGYSLDGQETVTTTGNITIEGLANGLHNITVYAKDNLENIGASDTISFNVDVPLPLSPSSIIIPIVLVVVIGIGLLVYFNKRKNRKD